MGGVVAPRIFLSLVFFASTIYYYSESISRVGASVSPKPHVVNNAPLQKCPHTHEYASLIKSMMVWAGDGVG